MVETIGEMPKNLLEDQAEGLQPSLEDGDIPFDLIAGDGPPAWMREEGSESVSDDQQENLVAGEAAPLVFDSDEAMVLTLEDLFPDENGEVVISTDGDVPINLIASDAVDHSGVAADHVTAIGIDVSGLHFHTFESGLTIYFEQDALLQITADTSTG